MNSRQENPMIGKGEKRKLGDVISDLVNQSRDLSDEQTESRKKIHFSTIGEDHMNVDDYAYEGSSENPIIENTESKKKILFSSIVRFVELLQQKDGSNLKEDHVVKNPIDDLCDDGNNLCDDGNTRRIDDGNNLCDDDGNPTGIGRDIRPDVIKEISYSPFYRPFIEYITKFDLHGLFLEDSIADLFDYSFRGGNLCVPRIWTDVDGRLHYFLNKDEEPAPVGYSDEAAVVPHLREFAIKRRERAVEKRRNSIKDLRAAVCKVYDTWPQMENILTQVFVAITRQDDVVEIRKEEMVHLFYSMQDESPFMDSDDEEELLSSLRNPTEIFITARDLEKERETDSGTFLYKPFKWESMKMPYCQIRDAIKKAEDEMDALEDATQEYEEKSFKEKEEALNCKNFPSVSWVRRKKKKKQQQQLSGENDNNFFHGIPLAPRFGEEMNCLVPRVLDLVELAQDIWRDHITELSADMLPPRILSGTQEERLEFSKDWEIMRCGYFVPSEAIINRFRSWYDREKALTEEEKKLRTSEETIVMVFEAWGRMATLLGKFFDDAGDNNIIDVVKIDGDGMTKLFQAWFPMQQIKFYRNSRLSTFPNAMRCANVACTWCNNNSALCADAATTMPREVYKSLEARFIALKARHEAKKMRQVAVELRKKYVMAYKSLGVDVAADRDGFDYAACH